MQFDGVIFDWAGTTVDYGCFAEKYGRRPDENDVLAMFNMFEEKLLSILHNFAEVKDGVCETVRVLRAQGLKIGSTTGYNDKMMSIIVPAAKANGYAPDVWFSPDSVGGAGRPKPYRIFKNMEALGLCDVRRVLKVGDTASDITEGKNAGADYVIQDIRGLLELVK